MQSNVFLFTYFQKAATNIFNHHPVMFLIDVGIYLQFSVPLFLF